MTLVALAVFGLALGPRILAVAAVRAQYLQRSSRATVLRRLAFFLRPTPAYRFSFDLSAAFEQAAQDGLDLARKRLQRWPERSSFGRCARVHLLRWEARWPEVLSECGRGGGDLGVRLTRLRALGELADADAFESLWESDAAAFRHVAARDTSWLYLFAFAGRPDLVKRLLATRLPPMARAVREFWMATAQLAAGDDSARERLESLLTVSDATLSSAVRWRLGNGPFAPLVSELIVFEQTKTFEQVLRFGRSRGQGAPAAAIAVALSVGVAHVAKVILSAWMDPDDVMMLGSMFAPDVLARNEWWRVVSYAWLHDGFTHLAVNAVGLYALGAWLERTLGARRFLGIYLFSCAGAGLFSVLVWRFGLVPAQAIVGASGGVMGLVGAMAAVFLRGAAVEKSPAARRGLWFVSLLVVLQTALDIAVPQISFLTHASGLAVGFVVGLAVSKSGDFQGVAPAQSRRRARRFVDFN